MVFLVDRELGFMGLPMIPMNLDTMLTRAANEFSNTLESTPETGITSRKVR